MRRMYTRDVCVIQGLQRKIGVRVGLHKAASFETAAKNLSVTVSRAQDSLGETNTAFRLSRSCMEHTAESGTALTRTLKIMNPRYALVYARHVSRIGSKAEPSICYIDDDLLQHNSRCL